MTVSVSRPTSEFGSRHSPSVLRVVGFTAVATDSERTPMSALSQQPVSFAIGEDLFSFQVYSSSALTSTCGAGIDRGVPCCWIRHGRWFWTRQVTTPLRAKVDRGVVSFGFGTESGTDYWKVMSVAGVHPVMASSADATYSKITPSSSPSPGPSPPLCILVVRV